MMKMTIKTALGLAGLAVAFFFQADSVQILGAFVAGACLDSIIMSKLSDVQRAKLEELLDKKVG